MRIWSDVSVELVLQGDLCGECCKSKSDLEPDILQTSFPCLWLDTCPHPSSTLRFVTFSRVSSPHILHSIDEVFLISTCCPALNSALKSFATNSNLGMTDSNLGMTDHQLEALTGDGKDSNKLLTFMSNFLNRDDSDSQPLLDYCFQKNDFF